MKLVADRLRRRHGNTELEGLFLREYDGMVRLAFLMLSELAEAEDLVQDSFVEVSLRIDQLDAPGAYLRRVVVNRCYSALRRRRVAERQTPEGPTALTDSADELWDVLDTLTEVQRMVVVLRYYQGFTPADIATALDLRPATVRSHLRRGLAALRKELS